MNKISTLSPGLAREYSAGSTYEVGQYVLWRNAYWKCSVAITVPEEWTPAHWTLDDSPLDYKADLVDGKVPAAQLPSYVDDVVEFDAKSVADVVTFRSDRSYAAGTAVKHGSPAQAYVFTQAHPAGDWTGEDVRDAELFPVPGEKSKIYVALNTDTQYRWSGSAYVEMAKYIPPYASSPEMDGNASAGSADSYARGDHVHPTDTSRASVEDATLEEREDGSAGGGDVSWTISDNVINPISSEGLEALRAAYPDADIQNGDVSLDGTNLLIGGYRVATLWAIPLIRNSSYYTIMILGPVMPSDWADVSQYIGVDVGGTVAERTVNGYVLGNQGDKPIASEDEVELIRQTMLKKTDVVPPSTSATSGKAADAKATGDELAGKLNKSGGVALQNNPSNPGRLIIESTASGRTKQLSIVDDVTSGQAWELCTTGSDPDTVVKIPVGPGTLALAASPATSGNLAALDSNGNPTDSGLPKSNVESLVFEIFYPDGSVKSASEFRDDIKYNFDTTNHTATVKPFCNTDGTAENDNSNLSGRVVIPPFVDASGNGYISDDGTRFKVVGVSGGYSPPGAVNTNLTAIITPNTVATIGDKAFNSCTALTSLSLPAATTVEGGAFNYCAALTSLSLPAATTIKGSAFSNCIILLSVDFGDTPRPTVPTLGVNAFMRVPADCKIIVPYTQYDAWIAAENWRDLQQEFVRHAEKADKPATFTTGNLAVLDSSGNPTDSGKSLTDIQDQIDTESPLLARSYAVPQQTGWTVGQGSSSNPIYFRPRFFGMKDGDLFKGIVLRTRNTGRTPFPSGVYMRLKRYSDGQTLGVSELTVWPDTANTDVVFRFPRAVELTSSGNYYTLDFSATPAGSAVNFGMSLYSLPSGASNPDFYFASSTNVPIATAQFYSWEELTGADIAVSGTDATRISAALALKANDNEVVKLTGDQNIYGIKTFNSAMVTAGINARGSVSANGITIKTDYNLNFLGSGNILMDGGSILVRGGFAVFSRTDGTQGPQFIIQELDDEGASIGQYSILLPFASGTLALTSDLKYSLTTKTISNSAVALDDRACNYVDARTLGSSDSLDVDFPDLVDGKSRDFVLAVECGANPPTISYAAFVTIMAEDASTLTPEEGMNIYSFTEFKTNMFLAARKTVSTVVVNSPESGDQLMLAMQDRGVDTTGITDFGGVETALGLGDTDTPQDAVDAIMN